MNKAGYTTRIHALRDVVWLFIQSIFARLGLLRSKKPHTGGKLLIPEMDALHIQPALAAAVGINKAIILQKIYEWMLYNESAGKLDHLIEGEYHTYRSAEEWREAHFTWLNASTVKRLFQELEKDGFLRSRQHRKDRGDCRKWVAIPAAARERIVTLCGDYTTPTSSVQKTPTPIQKSPMPESNASTIETKDSPTKEESPTQKHPRDKAAIKKQPPSRHNLLTEIETVETAAVKTPRSTLSVLAVSTAKASSNTAIDADHSQDLRAMAPITLVPQTPLPPLGSATTLIAEMQCMYGTSLADGHAANLIREYGEERVRAVHWYTASRLTKWESPVAFLTSEIRKDTLHLAPQTADSINPYAPSSQSPALPAMDIWNRQRLDELEQRAAILPPAPPQGLDEIVNNGQTVGKIWAIAHQQFRLLLDRPFFDIALKSAHLIGYDASTLTYRIGVPTERAQSMLQQRYYRSLQKVVANLHSPLVILTFEVQAASPLLLTDAEREELEALRIESKRSAQS